MLQITVEYTRMPQQVFISIENRDPPGYHVSLHWVKAPEPPAEEEQLQERLQGNRRDVHKQKTYFTLNPVFLMLHSLCTPTGIPDIPKVPGVASRGPLP